MSEDNQLRILSPSRIDLGNKSIHGAGRTRPASGEFEGG